MPSLAGGRGWWCWSLTCSPLYILREAKRSEAAPVGYVEGLTRLAARGHEVVVIHVLAPDEVEPPLGGDLRLLDVETGEPQEVTIDARMRTCGCWTWRRGSLRR